MSKEVQLLQKKGKENEGGRPSIRTTTKRGKKERK